jgi:hypothetical protein
MARQVINDGELGSVVRGKLNDMSTEIYAGTIGSVAESKLVGRGSASGTGVFETITIGSGLTMNGTTLSASGGGGGTVDTTLQDGSPNAIANNAVYDEFQLKADKTNCVVIATATWNNGIYGPLKVQATDYPSVRLYSTTQDKTVGCYLGPAGSLRFWVDGTGDTLGTERLVVTGAGVGFGETTVPIYAIDLKQVAAGAASGVRIVSSSDSAMLQLHENSGSFRIVATFSTTGAYQPLVLSTGGVDTITCDASGNLVLKPSASVIPAANGDLVIEKTSNTSLTFKVKGSDGTVRSGSITLS